jgi:hypothetical protein
VSRAGGRDSWVRAIFTIAASDLAEMGRCGPWLMLCLSVRRMRPTFAALALVPLFALSVACGDDPGGAVPLDAGAPRPAAPLPPPAPLATQGTFALDSPIDLTAYVLAPESVAEDIRLLRGLRDDPAGTFFQLLDNAGVPLVGDLYGVLPGPLQDQVKGWLNEAILDRSSQGQPLTAELDVLLTLADEALVRFHLLTDLTLPSRGAAGVPLARHGLRGIRYDFLGGRLPVEIPRFVAEHTGIVSETEAPVGLVAPGAASDGTVELGDHAFGVPFGQYAFAALDLVSNQRYGASLRPALGRLFGCAEVASAVAGKCAGFVCVDHQAALAAICERGLDEVVDRIHEGLQAYNFNAVRFQSGRAQLWDARAAGGTKDSQVDRIDGGVWQAFIDIGQGPRDVKATFSGQRESR